MLNILLPLAGKSQFFKETDYVYPKPLIEVAGRPIIERVIENLATISRPKRFIFILNDADCQQFHLDSSVQLLSPAPCEILRLKQDTAGAACSALMAIEHINNDSPLLISNGDQLIEANLDTIIQDFDSKQVDAGIVCFDSIHPRWSFARIDDKGLVSEAAEKRPISRHAIAGLYYFKKGLDFVHGAMQSIRKNASINGSFYIAPILNEIILQGGSVAMHKISNDQYHTFYAPQRIEEYEKQLWGSK